MKVYRTVSMKVTKTHRNGLKAPMSVFRVFDDAGRPEYGVLQFRAGLLRDWHLEGKALLKMLPAWAKHTVAKSLGAKVTAFYALNNRVVTDCSGIVVGSDEYYDWVETQPDPFRSCRLYREALGELRA